MESMSANPKQEKGHWISQFWEMAGIWKACRLIQSKKKGIGLVFFANVAESRDILGLKKKI